MAPSLLLSSLPLLLFALLQTISVARTTTAASFHIRGAGGISAREEDHDDNREFIVKIPPFANSDEIITKESTHSPTISSPSLPLASYQGTQLLVSALTSSKTSAVLTLLQSLETQMNLGACALASAVTVLNAMGHRQPHDPTLTYSTLSYAYWTQTSYAYDACVQKHVGPSLYQGETLQQLSDTLKCLGLKTSTRYAEDASSQKFHDEVVAHLEANHHVIINFDRRYAHEAGSGHFSPLGAVVEGKILILDVARYKYPPTWVPYEDLYAAMLSKDEGTGRSRGFVAVWK